MMKNTGNTAITKYQWKILFASIMGYAMDGLDMLILSFAMTAIISTFDLSLAEGGMIATITLIGAVLGGYAAGILSDIYGRIKTFALTIVLFAIFTGLSAFADSYAMLNIYRFMAGVGLGGEFAIGMTLVAETWPREMRARATAGVSIGWQMGVILAAVVSAYVLPTYGWRTVFLIGALPALFAAWARFGLEEPLQWRKQEEKKLALRNKISAGNADEHEQEKYKTLTKFPLLHLFKDAEITKKTIALTIMTSVQNTGYYGIMVWLPTILMNQHGLTLTKTSLWMIVTVIGMILGISVFGYVADKLGRRPTYMIFWTAAAVAVWVYSTLSSSTGLLVGGTILGFFANSGMGAFGALLSENYATEARSTAGNFIFNTGRAVGGFAPVVIGMMAAQYTLTGAIALLAFMYIGAVVVVYFLVPETKGAELPETV